MIKLTIALAASFAVAGVAGAQMTDGNTMGSMQSSSSSTTKTTAKPVMHKKRVVTRKTTHHTTTTTGAGTMGNSM